MSRSLRARTYFCTVSEAPGGGPLEDPASEAPHADAVARAMPASVAASTCRLRIVVSRARLAASFSGPVDPPLGAPPATGFPSRQAGRPRLSSVVRRHFHLTSEVEVTATWWDRRAIDPSDLGLFEEVGAPHKPIWPPASTATPTLDSSPTTATKPHSPSDKPAPHAKGVRRGFRRPPPGSPSGGVLLRRGP